MTCLRFAIFSLVLALGSDVLATDGFIDDSVTPAPASAKMIAVERLALEKAISASVVLKEYKIEWLYSGWYDDDQPLWFWFKSERDACFLEVGSQTLMVYSFSCR